MPLHMYDKIMNTVEKIQPQMALIRFVDAVSAQIFSQAPIRIYIALRSYHQRFIASTPQHWRLPARPHHWQLFALILMDLDEQIFAWLLVWNRLPNPQKYHFVDHTVRSH